jgi:hypothetical protein
MSRRNALMEWIDQTKRLSKSKDYMALNLIDSVIENIDFINQKIILNNRIFLKNICERYHKPNPVLMLKKNKVICSNDNCYSSFSNSVQSSFDRVIGLEKDIAWQWFEIIDFMYERPELVGTHLIDDYVSGCISIVCKKYKKNNPLINGIRERFGKYYKDDLGRWRKERRKRF